MSEPTNHNAIREALAPILMDVVALGSEGELSGEAVLAVVNDIIEARLRQVEKCPTLLGWRGMLSAPVDGSEIILTDGVRCDAGRWVSNRRERGWFGARLSWQEPYGTPPVLWMPLPVPPNLQPALTRQKADARHSAMVRDYSDWINAK